MSFALPIALAAAVAVQDSQRIEWHTDFEAARELAAEQRAPLFVVIRCER